MIAKILRFSIYNRFLVILMSLLLAGYGVYAFKKLPIDAVPDITNNQIQINTVAPGLSPHDVEKGITFPIENALMNIPSLEMTRSISRSGFSQVTAIFKDKVDIYFARQQVNEKLSVVKHSLPDHVEPQMGPISTGLGEVYMWTVDFKHPEGRGAVANAGEAGWQSDGRYLTAEGLYLKTPAELASYLRTIQDWIIKPQLKSIPGIADIDSIGGYVRQYHVTFDPFKMISLGITSLDIINALEKSNLSLGAGYIEFKGETYVVTSDNRVRNFDQIGRIVITSKEGSAIRISDVADIGIGEELRTGNASYNGHETVVGTALMLIGANSRTIATAVHEKLQEISKNLPSDIVITTALNRTKLVNSTIKTIFLNLSEGAFLVILILLLMLHNFRAALVAASVIPLAMLMTAIGMVKFEISGNLMSLGALDFGLIVDGAIIITENCLRRIGARQRTVHRALSQKERQEEILEASKEMIQPTVYGQAIIMIVYIPILAFQGVEGKMFHPMAITVLFALLSAFILSLTFVPAMISCIVSKKIIDNEGLLIQKTRRYYHLALEKTLRHRLSLCAASLVLMGGSMVIFMNMGSEFIPALDEQDIAMQATRIPSTSLGQSSKMQLQVEKSLLEQPEVEFVFSKTGTAEIASDPMPPNLSDTFIMLKQKKEWKNPRLPKNELIKNLESLVEQLPGNRYEFTQPIQMRFNELIGGTRGDLAVKIYGDDYVTLEKVGQQISHILQQIPGSEDIKESQAQGQPTLDIQINKEAISRLGLTESDVLEAAATAIGGSNAGVVFEGDRRFELMVRLPEHLRSDLKTLERLPILLPNHQRNHLLFPYVLLSEVASLKMTEGINEILRENGKRVYIVQSNVRGRDLGSFVSSARAKVEAEVKLPSGYWLQWGGQFENLESAKKQLYILVPICLLIIFFLLYSALHALREAILVFSGVPLAISGGIFALWISQIPFSISAGVGFIALSGIAVLNGLVMMTYIKQLITQGMEKNKAIIEGALTRLRPILMTALVASLGFIPMALSTGTGAEVQKPLAIVVIGGLVSSTLLTLFIIPALCAQFLKPSVVD